MWPDDETPEPAAWINFNAATGERNVSFVCESELASIPLWPEPPRSPRKPLSDEEIKFATFAERDDLLDHIYEYGTAAEGVLERINKLARAIEAAHGIKGHEA